MKNAYSPLVKYSKTCLLIGLFFLSLLAGKAAAEQPSWMFRRGQYTHDPMTGARVAQYDRIAPVEALDDPRTITSTYRRSRTVLRGADGSQDTYTQVQSYGNGRGGLDAEWERFHGAWRNSYQSGGYYQGGYSTYPGYQQPWNRPVYPHARPFGGGYGYGSGRYGFQGNSGY